MSGVAIITGASRGIGRAIAHRFAKDGFRVALNDLPSAKDSLEEVKKDILESGGGVGIYYADVSKEDDVQTMVADVVSTMGSVDVVSHILLSGYQVVLRQYIHIKTDGRHCWTLHRKSAYRQ